MLPKKGPGKSPKAPRQKRGSDRSLDSLPLITIGSLDRINESEYHQLCANLLVGMERQSLLLALMSGARFGS